jgi:cytochrome c5
MACRVTQRDKIPPDMKYSVVGAAAILFGAAYLASAQDGGAIYQKSCAPCHDGGADRAPTHEALHAMTPERVLAAMESGPMISMANRQSECRSPRHCRVHHRQVVLSSVGHGALGGRHV